MLRSSLGLLRAPQTTKAGTRFYSEGFEISNFLSRIEAITKKAVPPRSPRRPGDRSSRPPAQQGTKQRSAGPTKASGPRRATNNSQKPDVAGSPRQPPRQPRPSGPRTAQGAERKRPTRPEHAQGQGQFRSSQRPRTETAAPNSTQARAQGRRGGVFTSKATPTSPDTNKPVSNDEGWSSLDSFAAVSKPLPRSNRRTGPRKVSTKGKTDKKTGKPRTARAAKPQRNDALDREQTPYLSPQEGLDVILRNEGTSCGGFISPIDVSLPALQGNLVESAVSYNSRVRTLLRSVSEDVAEDRERLKKLTDSYVSGVYDKSILDAGKGSLSYEALAREVFANRSMDNNTRHFFAEVGSGKLSPKQIVARL